MNAVVQQNQGPINGATAEVRRPAFVPHTDIHEVDGDYVVSINLPGATPDSIKVNYEEGNLTIEADVKDRQPPDTKFLVREYGVGNFHRSFRVADSIDAARIDANYREGVLQLRLPRAEKVKPRQVEVK